VDVDVNVDVDLFTLTSPTLFRMGVTNLLNHWKHG